MEKQAKKVYIYEGILHYLSKCILDFDIETGGDLFGSLTSNGDFITQAAIGADENAQRSQAFFKQNKKFLEENGKFIHEHHGLHHIGNWHSHHRLGIPNPSGHDSKTMFNAIHNNNLSQFLLIIGTIDKDGKTGINGFVYNNEGKYYPVEWVILPNKSPIDESITLNIDKELVYTPKTKKANISQLKIHDVEAGSPKQETMAFNEALFYTSEKGKTFLKGIYDQLSGLIEDPSIKMYQMEGSLEIEVATENESIVIHFPNNYPEAECKIDFQQNTLKGIEKIIQTKTTELWTKQG